MHQTALVTSEAPLVMRWRYASSSERLASSRDDGRLVVMEHEPLTREQTIAAVTAVETDLRALGVARLALFGSVLRNAARADSDVDLLVEFVPGGKSFERFMALADLLEARLGRHVELVTTEALSPFIGPRILAEAQDVVRAA
jgi:hypothetical protein